MSTPFNVRAWASQAGIQTTGGFAVIAECVTLDELERFAQIAISQYLAAPQPQPAQPLTDEQIEALLVNWPKDGIAFFDFARAVEAAHGIKEQS